MTRRIVQAPDGRTWTVRRRWAPRLGSETLWGRFRQRIKGTFRRTGEIADVGGDTGTEVDVIVIVLLVIVAVLLAVFVVVPLLVALVDVLIIVLIAGLSVLGRIVFRRPWTLEARADDGTSHTWKVVGWRASNERRDQIADELAAGVVPAQEQPTP